MTNDQRQSDPKELQRVINILERRLLAKEQALIWVETELTIAKEDFSGLWAEHEKALKEIDELKALDAMRQHFPGFADVFMPEEEVSDE
jgi:hypothetical protein